MTANSLKSLELQSLRLLSSKYIVQLLNDFTYDGPYRVRRCLIFELLGPIVYMVLPHHSKGKDKLEPEELLRMSK